MQIFLKDFKGSRSTQVVAPASPSVTVSRPAMTPDAATVVFTDAAPNGIRKVLRTYRRLLP